MEVRTLEAWTEGHSMLQWGHDKIVMEVGSESRDDHVYTRFNGAMTK